MDNLQDLDLKNKKVLIRSDLNVPLDDKGGIADDLRIKAALETINFCIEKGAKVIVCSHLGRPKGERKPEFSLKPVAEYLKTHISSNVSFSDDCIGEKTSSMVDSLKPGEVLLLENLRFHPEETSCDEGFSKELASLADIYVNDAFGTSHRKHSSTYGVKEFFNQKALGILMQREVDTLRSLFGSAKQPLLIALGGAKISTKIKLIKSLSEVADKILIGGAMANTFLKAEGYSLGKSLVEDSELDTARSLMSPKLLLPTDCLVAKEFKEGAETRVCKISEVGDDEMIVDIGPETTKSFSEEVKSAGTAVWNGPFGAFEIPAFSKGTYEFATAFAQSSAKSIVGGGDTNLALSGAGVLDKVDYVSTGGGAFLKFLEDKTLPVL